jgi:hypothetical protein
MTRTRRRLWRETARWPYARLAGGVVAAPMIATAVVWLVALAVGGLSETTQAGPLALADGAATSFFVLALLSTVFIVVPGTVILWGLGQPRWWAWAGFGLVAGAAMAVALSLGGDRSTALAAAISAGYAAFIMLTVRAIAGIRPRRREDG